MLTEQTFLRPAVAAAPLSMLRRRTGALLLAFSAVLFVGGHAAPALASEAPDALIQRLGTELIERIKSDKAIRDGDLSKLSALVDEVLMPHVNFRRMTSLAAGRWWRQATPEQREQLMTEFRAMLLRTYSGALASVDDQSIRMRPMRAAADATDVIVRSEIVQPRGEPIQLDYRLQKADAGWKIYDVNVLGIWLVETYRSQFNQEAAQSGVEGLIRSLESKNREFGPDRKS
jgi:phospholipid transport system substrate-binding protein